MCEQNNHSEQILLLNVFWSQTLQKHSGGGSSEGKLLPLDGGSAAGLHFNL